MKKNKELKEAETKLRTMSRAEYRERMAWFREKAILDYNTGISSALKRGREETLILIIKNMLKDNMSMNKISELTGLSEEEIKKLQVNV